MLKELFLSTHMEDAPLSAGAEHLMRHAYAWRPTVAAPFLQEEERQVVGLGHPHSAWLTPPGHTCCPSPPGWEASPEQVPYLMQTGPRAHRSPDQR